MDEKYLVKELRKRAAWERESIGKIRAAKNMDGRDLKHEITWRQGRISALEQVAKEIERGMF